MDEESRAIELLQKGEEAALVWLIDRYGNDVLRTASLLLKDRHLAEDVSQETFLTAFQRVNQYRGDGSIRAWLLQIAINLCRGRMRRAAWKRLFFRGLDGNGDNGRQNIHLASDKPGSVSWTDRLALRDEIGRLPLSYREVLALYYYHDLRTADIAKILKEPEGTVKSKLMRARNRLKQQLEEGGWGDEQRTWEG